MKDLSSLAAFAAVALAALLAACSGAQRKPAPIVSPSESQTLRDALNDFDPEIEVNDAKEIIRLHQKIPLPGLAAGAGHSGDASLFDYNIYETNCHTAANIFTAAASYEGMKAGIVVCGGNPETDPAHHTTNWVLTNDDRTCILNWGNGCCWKAQVSPPDIKSGLGLECAKKACGTQYSDTETRVLPAGQLVEMPQPEICAVAAAGGKVTMLPGLIQEMILLRADQGNKVKMPAHQALPEGAEFDFSPANMGKCLDCCNTRSKYWDPLNWAYDAHDQYLVGHANDADAQAKALQVQQAFLTRETGRQQMFADKCERFCRGMFHNDK